jgi:hypothetical protein
MNNFFHGWRRKVGCVTLVVALGFMGGWIRSLSVTDFCQLPVGRLCNADFVSDDGRFSCGWVSPTGPTRFNWRNFENRGPIAIRSRSLYFDFTDGTAPNPSGIQSQHIIPYWLIAIPLPLLSGYLILWQPLKLSYFKMMKTDSSIVV